MKVLRAGTLTLEPQRAAHADAMFDVLSDPAIYEFENTPPASLAALSERYARLESRRSTDGTEQWLNWVIRLPDDGLAGYVQATVLPGHQAYVAYELASRHSRKGIGSAALGAVLDELSAGYGVQRALAVLKLGNFRSRGLLSKLGFATIRSELAPWPADVDEIVMAKSLAGMHQEATASTSNRKR